MKPSRVLPWLLALPLGVALAQTTRDDVPNPHGDPEACGSCHTPAAKPGGELGPLTMGKVLPTCQTCHPDAYMHPMGIPAGSVTIPDAYPLEEGLITCATCHLEPAHGGADAEMPPPYHRGGPYTSPTGLCYSCHERGSYDRTDPHHPEKPRDSADPTCSACHSGLPEDGALPADSRLRAEVGKTCSSCHGDAVHLGVSSHVGQALDATMTETLGGDLPLAPDATIACYTCHEVHTPPVAVRTPNKALGTALRAHSTQEDWSGLEGQDLHWPGESAAEHPPLLALPSADGSLCQACHGDGP